VLHPVEDAVEPGAVRPLQRPDAEVEAELEGEVDLGRRGNALHDDVHRLVDQRSATRW